MTSETISKKSRVVLVRGMGEKISGKNPVLLFSTTQIEEILTTVTISEIPFAPDYLLGFCLWRKQVIPVVDTRIRYNLGTSLEQKTSSSERYMVVQTVSKVNKNQKLIQGVLKLSNQIVSTEIPGSCSPADTNSSNIDKSLIKGIFEFQDDLMIIPDLASIFSSI